MTVTNPYATISDLQALITAESGGGITLTTGTKPTLAQAEGWLDQVAAEIDGILNGAGYATVPATGTNDVLTLRRYVSQKAAAITMRARLGGFDDTPSRVIKWEEEYDTFLQRLIAKQVRLVDQSPLSKFGVIYVERYTGE